MTKKIMQRSLGIWRLIALVSGNMIGSGIFLLPAALGNYGSISIVAWVFASIGAMCLALIFARLSRRMPKIGGPYAYCHQAYGDFIGFQVAYCYWIALCIGNAAIVIAMIGYASIFWPALAASHLLSLVFGLAVLWLLTLINIVGIRLVGIVQVVTTILKLVPIVGVAIIGLLYGHISQLHTFNISGHSTSAALLATISLTLWSFVGFESATVPADDVIDPEKNIPRATVLGTGLAAVIYIGVTIAIMSLVSMHQLSRSGAPFALAAEVALGHKAALVIAIGAVIATFGQLNGWVLLQGQVPLAVARDGLFPKSFAKVTKSNTPIIGLVLGSVLISIMLILRYSAGLIDQFIFLTLLATLASLIPYLYTTLAEVILWVKDVEQFDRSRFIRASILAAFGFCYTLLAIFGVGKAIVYYGVLLMLTSVPFYAWVRYRQVIKTDDELI